MARKQLSKNKGVEMKAKIDTARWQLVTAIAGRNLIERPFNFDDHEKWGPTEQVNWAILQMKRAMRFSDRIPAWNIISLEKSQFDDKALKKDPRLLNLTAKAFAEVAKQDPDDVAVCSILRTGYFASLFNRLSPQIGVAVNNQKTAEELVHFARTASVQSSISSNPLVFDRK